MIRAWWQRRQLRALMQLKARFALIDDCKPMPLLPLAKSKGSVHENKELRDRRAK